MVNSHSVYSIRQAHNNDAAYRLELQLICAFAARVCITHHVNIIIACFVKEQFQLIRHVMI